MGLGWGRGGGGGGDVGGFGFGFGGVGFGGRCMVGCEGVEGRGMGKSRWNVFLWFLMRCIYTNVISLLPVRLDREMTRCRKTRHDEILFTRHQRN